MPVVARGRGRGHRRHPRGRRGADRGRRSGGRLTPAHDPPRPGERAYVGLGANLGEPRAQIEWALDRLERLARTGSLERSSLYRSEPLGPADQPWYVNAVASFEPELDPDRLLDALQALEREAGRVRDGTRYGPRSLDLDLLIYGERRIDVPGLRVPHPRFSQRRFVLEPLAELAPGLRSPDHARTVAEMLLGLDDPLRVEKLPAS